MDESAVTEVRRRCLKLQVEEGEQACAGETEEGKVFGRCRGNGRASVASDVRHTGRNKA